MAEGDNNAYWPSESLTYVDDGVFDLEELYKMVQEECIKSNFDMYELESIARRASVEVALESMGRPKRWYQLSEKERLWYIVFNIPITDACERLKDQISTAELRERCKYLLKVPLKGGLSQKDVLGDTRLMTLVKELESKPHLLPWLPTLIARMKLVNPFQFNLENEDILYFACMHCPSMPQVAGFVACLYIRDDININEKRYTSEGIPLLHAIVQEGDSHADILKEILLVKGSNGNRAIDVSLTHEGITPLHLAVQTHNTFNLNAEIRQTVETVRILMENGSDPLKQNPADGYTPLHTAISVNPDPRLIKELLENSGLEALMVKNQYLQTPKQLLILVEDDDVRQQISQMFE